jgi:hypothetical protein
MTYVGTVWCRSYPALPGIPARHDFALVEQEPHESLGQPHVYVKLRTVDGGKRGRIHKSVTTLEALVERYGYVQVDASEWPSG